jgi:hypothetical protein
VNGAAVPLTSAASRLAAVPGRPTDDALWAGRLHRLLRVEICLAVTSAALTAAEGDQLLARLVLVVDQAMAPSEP